MANRPLVIIDSDAASNSLLSDLLAPQGFAVTSYVSGKEGMDAVLASPPALVLLCLELSDMSGYVACKKIKEDGSASGVPIILMSKDATEKDFERHRKLKVAAQDYVRKPFESADILRKVENLVGFNVSEEAYESLEAKIEGMFEEGTTDDEIKLKQKEIDRMQSEMATLREELLRVKQHMGPSDDLKAKLLSVQTERDQLARRVQEFESGAVGSESVAAMEKKIAQLTKEVSTSQQKLELREGAFHELEMRLKEYQTELDKQLAGKQSLEGRYKAELEQLREELTAAEEEASGYTANLERRENELLQQIEGIREQTELMRNDYEKRLAEVREQARRALEQGLALLGS